MKIEIKIDAAQLDLSNLTITDYRNENNQLMEKFSKTELDFSSIGLLKGNKELLQKAFLNQKAESLNL
jgi:hypothetical protein